MTYYQRYIKIMPTTNKKNYPLSKLLFNYTGHDYEPLDFKGTYNDNTANECLEIFSKSLYKYTDKFIQTNNVITLNDYDEFKEQLKYTCNTTFIGNTSYEHEHGLYSDSMSISYDKYESPNPFDLMTKRSANKYDIITNYSNTYKHEIFIGLFKYDNLTHKYEFIFDSFYDKKKQMYYLYEKK